MMRRLWVLCLSAAVLLAIMPGAYGAGNAHSATFAKKKCKMVTKKVHGKKKKVKVCQSARPPAAKPTRTPTNTPTPTSTTTLTPTPTATPTQAPTTLDPSSFALSAADFPPSSTIQLSQVESNGDADNDKLLLHFDTASRDQEGRVTGYVMETGQANGGHPVLTYYLVSIFHSGDQARAAFAQQKLGFDTLLAANPSQFGTVTPPAGLGEQAAQYIAVLSVNGTLFDLSELMLTRGRVFIEVWQGFASSDLDVYAKPDLPYLYSIAQTLDSRVRSAGASRVVVAQLAPGIGILAAGFQTLVDRQRAPRAAAGSESPHHMDTVRMEQALSRQARASFRAERRLAS